MGVRWRGTFCFQRSDHFNLGVGLFSDKETKVRDIYEGGREDVILLSEINDGCVVAWKCSWLLNLIAIYLLLVVDSEIANHSLSAAGECLLSDWEETADCGSDNSKRYAGNFPVRLSSSICGFCSIDEILDNNGEQINPIYHFTLGPSLKTAFFMHLSL